MDKPKQKPAGVPAELYYNMLQGHPDGYKIFEELYLLFADRALPSPDPNLALFMEGQRSVMVFITQKCAEGQR